ncbi:MAG: YbhN family protein [Actinomycetota bacterium]
MSDTAPPAKNKRRKMPGEIRLILSVGVIIFVLEYAVVPEFGTARRSLKLLERLNPAVVALAVICEFLAIFAYSQLTRAVFTPFQPRIRDSVRVNLSALGLSHVIPGGTAPAGALSYRLYSSMEVPNATNVFGLAAQGIGSAVVLNILFWVALVISIPLRGFNPAYGFAALAGVFLLAAFFGTIILLMRGQRQADSWIRAFVVKMPFVKPEHVGKLLDSVADRVTLLTSRPQLLRSALYWAAANWVLDAACLWVFLWAFGYPISPVDLMVAYGLANILAVIPITPGGLGVIEGTLIPTIVGFGVPHTPAILAVLAYRLVNFWIPIPVGAGAYFSLRWKPALAISEINRNGSV